MNHKSKPSHQVQNELSNSQTIEGQSGEVRSRRGFFKNIAAVTGVSASALTVSSGAAALSFVASPAQAASKIPVVASEHWAVKKVGNEDIKLFILNKKLKSNKQIPKMGTILFVHGSSMAGSPVFDLQVPGKPEYSTMDYFAKLGYDTWCLDHEGYGRSSKSRDISYDISTGADDLEAVSRYISEKTGENKLMLYGVSSGALRSALFAERFPERVSRIILDAFVWTGEGSPTLANRRKKIDEWKSSNRRPLDHAMVQSIFTRDHPGTADQDVIDAFANAILKLDSSLPTGTYIDMSINLPVCTPEKLTVPTMILRGEFDGIAAFDDVVKYFTKLPNPDKRIVVMPGIAHASLQEKNFKIVLHAMENFFSQPPAIYKG
jgi:pimeloyl-ACP methyl ester carboxylesterase